MKSERRTEIKVGITAIFSLIVFLWIMVWAKNFIVSASDIDVKLNFDNVSGLETGDIVTVNGLRKGFVKDISLDRNIIIVKISIDSDVDLREDAKFWLATVDLMGDKKIEIEPGNSTRKLDLTKMHRGGFQPDLTSMLKIIGSFDVDITSIVKDLKSILSSLNNFVADEQVMSELKGSIKNLNLLSNRLNTMLAENQDDVKRITGNTAQLTENTNDFFNENKDAIKETIANLNSASLASDSLLFKINYLTDETLNGNNNLGSLLYSDSLTVDLKNSLKRIKELSRIILEQLREHGIKIDAYIF